jgi:hypothetical protein
MWGVAGREEKESEVMDTALVEQKNVVCIRQAL